MLHSILHHTQINVLKYNLEVQLYRNYCCITHMPSKPLNLATIQQKPVGINSSSTLDKLQCFNVVPLPVWYLPKLGCTDSRSVPLFVHNVPLRFLYRSHQTWHIHSAILTSAMRISIFGGFPLRCLGVSWLILQLVVVRISSFKISLVPIK